MPSHRRYTLTADTYAKIKGRYKDTFLCCVCEAEGITNLFKPGDDVVSKKGRWYCIKHATEKGIIE